ncbi:Hypothetical protein POVN_LOCUS269 [uncultured virus]|nr:Hypothetical protein POVN_LOCUS269 [uncultured virus]
MGSCSSTTATVEPLLPPAVFTVTVSEPTPATDQIDPSFVLHNWYTCEEKVYAITRLDHWRKTAEVNLVSSPEWDIADTSSTVSFEEIQKSFKPLARPSNLCLNASSRVARQVGQKCDFYYREGNLNVNRYAAIIRAVREHVTLLEYQKKQTYYVENDNGYAERGYTLETVWVPNTSSRIQARRSYWEREDHFMLDGLARRKTDDELVAEFKAQSCDLYYHRGVTLEVTPQYRAYERFLAKKHAATGCHVKCHGKWHYEPM